MADLREFLLDLSLVALHLFHIAGVALVALLFLDGGQDSPSGSSSAYNVFEGHRQNVSFFEGELFATELGKLGCVFHHLVVAFALLCKSRQVK